VFHNSGYGFCRTKNFDAKIIVTARLLDAGSRLPDASSISAEGFFHQTPGL